MTHALNTNMNVRVNFDYQHPIKKILFSTKPICSDGLLLKIYQDKSPRQSNSLSCSPSKVRFLRACFEESGKLLACLDNEGFIILFDLSENKYWSLGKMENCNIIKFSVFNSREILAGTSNGTVFLIDIITGCLCKTLLGHKYPVKNITFSKDHLCLTATNREGIIWNLKTRKKIQILSLKRHCKIKFCTFIPVSYNIIACFKDDLIQIWKYDTLEHLRQLIPACWNNYFIRNVTFTSNGINMLIAGKTPNIAVLSFKTWDICKYIKLPDYIHSVRHIEIIPGKFDWDSNKFLAILAGDGCIYFYHLEQEQVINKIVEKYEITRFELSQNNQLMAVLLCNGKVLIYYIIQYLKSSTICTLQESKKLKTKLSPKCNLIKEQAKCKMNEILSLEKLQNILKEFGEYPENYRVKIWEILLQLPNNRKQYDSLINKKAILAFEDLEEKYPLVNKNCINSVNILLSNLVNWCQFFGKVEYLPLLVFPFVKVFQNKPIACFEAVCSILVNWCQYWFEYFPLPPVNILAIVENLLLEHDPIILNHFTENKIKPVLYIWPLLETLFTEVLSAKEWLLFWDHVLTNEPSFLLCAVVAYILVHKNSILELNEEKLFVFFFRNQNINEMKAFLSKTYFILNNTSCQLHPRQYLNAFKPIESGNYPLVLNYPKTIINFEHELERLEAEKRDMTDLESMLIKNTRRANMGIKNDEKSKLEEERKKEVDDVYKMKISEEKQKLIRQHLRLEKLKNALLQEEKQLFDITLRKTPKESTEKISKKSKIDGLCLKNKKEEPTVHIISNILSLIKLTKNIEKELKIEIKKKPATSISKTKIKKYETDIKKSEEEVNKLLQILSYVKDHKSKITRKRGVQDCEVLFQKIDMNLESEDSY